MNMEKPLTGTEKQPQHNLSANSYCRYELLSLLLKLENRTKIKHYQ